MTGPAHAIEIERTYDVDESTVLPDWTLVDGVSVVGPAEVRELDAVYFDTDALDLAAQRVAVRRRTGGPDAGWHIKAAAADGKHEWTWPLDETAEDCVPPAIAATLAGRTEKPLVPVARIRTTRTARALRNAEGDLIAEMVDDRVHARALHTGAAGSWREWEVELGPAGPADTAAREAFFARVDALVTAAGGVPARVTSKLGRTLALAP